MNYAARCDKFRAVYVERAVQMLITAAIRAGKARVAPPAEMCYNIYLEIVIHPKEMM